MRLTVFNGSPRGKDSNTNVYLEHFLSGFLATEGNIYEIFYLNRVKRQDEFVKMFREAEQVLLAFPLYTDAMPAMVKTFIESLESLLGRKENPPIGFMVQCGFPEAIHIRSLEAYLEKLARRLGSAYAGSIVKGGGEGARMMPERFTKIFGIFHRLGQTFGETGCFDDELLHKLAKPEKFTKMVALMYKPLLKTKLFRMGWDNQLKENDAFDKRWDHPYVS